MEYRRCRKSIDELKFDQINQIIANNMHHHNPNTQQAQQPQQPQPIPQAQQTHHEQHFRPSSIISAVTIYSIQQDGCHLIYYLLMVLFTTGYVFSFMLYVMNHQNNKESLRIGNIDILYINIFNMFAIMLHIFIIILCLIFGYQYKLANEYLHGMHRVRLNFVLSRFNQITNSKIKKCLLLIRFYKILFFTFDWTGIWNIMYVNNDAFYVKRISDIDTNLQLSIQIIT